MSNALERARELICAAVDACTYNSEDEATKGIYGLPSGVLIPMSLWLADHGLPKESVQAGGPPTGADPTPDPELTAEARCGEKHSEVPTPRTPTKLLAAYTPELYEGAYPPYFNVTQVGSMVRITMRGATLPDGKYGETAVAVVNVWTLNEVAKAFVEAAANFETGFDSDPKSMA